MKRQYAAIVLVLTSLTGVGQMWAGARRDVGQRSVVTGSRSSVSGLPSSRDSLPSSVKWYLEQREKRDWFMQEKPFGEVAEAIDFEESLI
jgi:hypothetical protein